MVVVLAVVVLVALVLVAVVLVVVGAVGVAELTGADVGAYAGELAALDCGSAAPSAALSIDALHALPATTRHAKVNRCAHMAATVTTFSRSLAARVDLAPAGS